ncbi:hypothetical protein [Corynebacterium macginleyi]|uniref:hypothetical protein n=1 Tax=Corynebacterium macginleyi TaxID=38290 RepID=UPI001EEF8A51|nr:hypothetical protein [Corynebacterium macginleyi]
MLKNFQQWASGIESIYTREYFHRQKQKVECVVHADKVSASRNQLAELLKPQNHTTQFVFVPTESEWTAVFSPCCFTKAPKMPRIGEFAYCLARKKKIESQVPYYIEIKHTPWVDTDDVAFFHRASYGDIDFMMCALPSELPDDSLGRFDCCFYRSLSSHRKLKADGTLHRFMSYLEDQSEPFKDYGFDFSSLPKVTEFPQESFTQEHAQMMWSQFGEKQIEAILAPLGVSPYDDAFYGTNGYLARLTPAHVVDPHTNELTAAPDFDPPARIPLEKYQFFQGLHDGPLRSWSSTPITE